MDKTCQVRRQIAERVLKGIAIRAHFSVSLENAKVCKPMISLHFSFYIINILCRTFSECCLCRKYVTQVMNDEVTNLL